MKTQIFVWGTAMAFLLAMQPVSAQESPTEKIKKESNKVINRNIEKLFNRNRKKEEAEPAPQPAQEQPAHRSSSQEQNVQPR